MTEELVPKRYGASEAEIRNFQANRLLCQAEQHLAEARKILCSK